MTHSRTSRTLAATSVTAALLCGLPGVTDTVAAGSCRGVRNGQNYIDWARARSGQNHRARPDRQTRRLEMLLDAGDGPRDGQSYIDWARARSGQSSTSSPNRRAQPLRLLFSAGAANGK
jgi:hypothetical protein